MRTLLETIVGRGNSQLLELRPWEVGCEGVGTALVALKSELERARLVLLPVAEEHRLQALMNDLGGLRRLAGPLRRLHQERTAVAAQSWSDDDRLVGSDRAARQDAQWRHVMARAEARRQDEVAHQQLLDLEEWVAHLAAQGAVPPTQPPTTLKRLEGGWRWLLQQPARAGVETFLLVFRGHSSAWTRRGLVVPTSERVRLDAAALKAMEVPGCVATLEERVHLLAAVGAVRLLVAHLRDVEAYGGHADRAVATVLATGWILAKDHAEALRVTEGHRDGGDVAVRLLRTRSLLELGRVGEAWLVLATLGLGSSTNADVVAVARELLERHPAIAEWAAERAFASRAPRCGPDGERFGPQWRFWFEAAPAADDALFWVQSPGDVAGELEVDELRLVRFVLTTFGAGANDDAEAVAVADARELAASPRAGIFRPRAANSPQG